MTAKGIQIAQSPERRPAATLKRDARPEFRDFLVAVSLANLFFIRNWWELLSFSEAESFYIQGPPSRAYIGSLLLNVLWLGTAFWCGSTLFRKHLRGFYTILGRGMFMLALLIPLNGLRDIVPIPFSYLAADLLGMIGVVSISSMLLVLCLVSIFIFVKYSRQIAHGVSVFLVILAPFAGWTFLRSGWAMVRYDATLYLDSAAPWSSGGAEPAAGRVLWVIFDEWDYRLTFEDRPAGLNLEVLDRFRTEALHATNAYPPATTTHLSIPSMMSGLPVQSIHEVGPRDALLSINGREDQVLLSKQPTIFSEAFESRINTAVLGWHIPYCRVFDRSLSFCRWWSMKRRLYNYSGHTIPEIMPNQIRVLFETFTLSPFGQSLGTQTHRNDYLEILKQARDLASSRTYGLVLVHFPIPHAPYFFDVKSKGYTLANSGVQGYGDSLELVNNTIRTLREAMEQAGTWDQTAVLMTSDHYYRDAVYLDGKSGHRIPFLLKLPWQRGGVVYEPSFNTVVVRDLLSRILKGDLSKTEEVEAWLDQARCKFRPGLNLPLLKQADSSEVEHPVYTREEARFNSCSAYQD